MTEAQAMQWVDVMERGDRRRTSDMLDASDRRAAADPRVASAIGRTPEQARAMVAARDAAIAAGLEPEEQDLAADYARNWEIMRPPTPRMRTVLDAAREALRLAEGDGEART